MEPWVPGQSGNPRGSSRKLRTKRFLKEFLNEEINKAITPEIAEALSAQGVTAEDLTFAHVIAMRIVAGAAKGDRSSIDQILSTEPKVVEVETLEPPKSPEYLPTAEDQAQLEAGTDEVVH